MDEDAMTRWCADALARLGLPALARRVRVCWNARLRSTAGRSWWPDALIELNPRVLEFGRAEVSRTLKHELAHVVARARSRRPIQPHGEEWRQACRELGIPREPACHELPLPKNRVLRPYHYSCPGCGRSFKRARAIRGALACGSCCKMHAGGRYDSRFQLKLLRFTPLKKIG